MSNKIREAALKRHQERMNREAYESDEERMAYESLSSDENIKSCNDAYKIQLAMSYAGRNGFGGNNGANRYNRYEKLLSRKQRIAYNRAQARRQAQPQGGRSRKHRSRKHRTRKH
jgi:hypothetical protein